MQSLSSQFDRDPLFYLDHNSTSPISDGIAHAIHPYLTTEFGNPSSTGNSFGRRAAEALQTARENLAELLQAKPEEVVFTSGGTESCFMALAGAFRARKDKRHLIISAVEHPAVLETASYLQDVSGIETSIIPVDQNGELNLNALFDAIRVDTGVLSFMLANNETGVLFPIREIVEMAQARGLLVHTDAVQAVGKIPLHFRNLGVDLLSLSGHKIGAVKGAGALIVREDTEWSGVVKGGGQEKSRRGGTEAVPLIVALGEAARLRKCMFHSGALQSQETLRNFFEQTLSERISGIRVNGGRTARLPNTSNICIDGTIAQKMIPLLEERGVIVSAGSACKANNPDPSHVLRAMGLNIVDCYSALRFSFGPEINRETVLQLVDILAETVAYFRAEVLQELRANLRV